MATHNPILEYLATTKIGEKGQLTVPKQFREDLGLENGAPFAVLRLGRWSHSSARATAFRAAMPTGKLKPDYCGAEIGRPHCDAP